MSEQYDIMVYGPGVCEPAGLMTKGEAEENAKMLPAGHYTVGWNHGTCQSVFQFWVPKKGHAIEIPHAEKPPTGRRAAIIAARLEQ